MISHQWKALIYDDYNYEEDPYYLNDQIRVFRPISNDPIRIIGAKVKKIKVETITETTITTTKIMLIGVDTTKGIDPKIEMVIRREEKTTGTRGVVSKFHLKIMIEKWEFVDCGDAWQIFEEG